MGKKGKKGGKNEKYEAFRSRKQLQLKPKTVLILSIPKKCAENESKTLKNGRKWISMQPPSGSSGM